MPSRKMRNDSREEGMLEGYLRPPNVHPVDMSSITDGFQQLDS